MAAAPNAPAADKVDSFSVTINDGHLNGTTTVTVSVAIAPATDGLVTIAGAPVSRVIVGAKGTLYQITAKVVISGGPSQASPTTQVSILA
ncbi:hypothetical protein C6A85_67015, partial [Mycobacterium sp. ITM-2017-0098]